MKRSIGFVLILMLGAVGSQLFASAYDEGMAALASKNYATALDKLEEAVASQPNNLQYGAEYRQVVIAAEAYDRCIAFFEALVEEHPDAPNAFLNLGFAYVDKIPATGAITQVILANTALGHFSKAIELEESWLALYTRGNSYLFWPSIFGRTPLGMADLEKALEIVENAETKKPYYARTYAALGDGYWRLEELDKARAVWQVGLDLFPGDSDLKARLARQGEELDVYLDSQFAPENRVSTELREIWGAP